MKKIFAPIALGSAALLLVACGDDANSNNNNNVAVETTETTTEVDATEETAEETVEETVVEGVGMIAAIETATAEEPGEVVHAEETHEHYDVHIRPADGEHAVEVKVDRETGEVDRTEERDLSDHEHDATTVTALEAIAIAEGEIPGEVTRVELTENHDADAAEADGEEHDRVVVWEIHVRDAEDDDRHEVVHVDAESGEVLEVTR